MSVRLIDVEKHFGPVVAVAGISLTIERGSFFSIIGASGCGKTTTLRMVAGFEHPDRGTIEVEGDDVTRLPAHRRPVNTVFQSYALFPHLDVFENVAFGLREARRPRDEIRRRVSEMIELVQLTGRERAKLRQLSGGQQQRVALARALVNRPKVLLLDEPLGALDLKLRRDMQGQLKEIQHELGITFVYVTHDQEEAFAMSDLVAVMNAGRIDQVGAPEEVYRRPASEFVAGFVGTTNRFEGNVTERLAQGRYRVHLDEAGTFECSGGGGLAPGDRVVVIVRPEDLELAPAGADPAGLVGTIADTSFMGAHRTLRIEAGDGRTLVASLRGGGDAGSPGERVEVGWDVGAAWIIGNAPAPEPELVDR